MHVADRLLFHLPPTIIRKKHPAATPVNLRVSSATYAKNDGTSPHHIWHVVLGWLKKRKLNEKKQPKRNKMKQKKVYGQAGIQKKAARVQAGHGW